MRARTILIADPDAPAAQRLRDQLVRLGYDAAPTAASAREAAALALAIAPDLVLIDAALGGVADEWQAAHDVFVERRIPTVPMIAEADEADFREAKGAAGDPCLVKPFTDRELRATIELAVCRDKALSEARDLEDRFFAVSIDMLCYLDFTGYFKRLNPAWERTLGFTLDELMSRPFIEFVHPDDRERTLAQNSVVRHGGQAIAFENRYLCKDGSFRWFLWNAAPDVGHRVIYSVARDITERKRLEEERERLVDELRAALAEVRVLQEILPICSYCRKIRDDENYWHTVEGYFARHTTTRFSHSICPSCMASKVEPELAEFKRELAASRGSREGG